MNGNIHGEMRRKSKSVIERGMWSQLAAGTHDVGIGISKCDEILDLVRGGACSKRGYGAEDEAQKKVDHSVEGHGRVFTSASCRQGLLFV